MSFLAFQGVSVTATNDTHKFNVMHIESDSRLSDSQRLLAAAFICRNDKTNPLELLAMLGLANDLPRVRISRRQRVNGEEES